MASLELNKIVSVIDEDSSDDDDEKITRIGSTESGTIYDDEEDNILSSLFDGISTQQLESSKEQIKMKCLNVTRTNASSKSIILKTGLRQLDEVRIIFKQRPLGIQIGPLNCHGFGAKITKIINKSVYNQGVREQMIITGLNNKDLLGCTFDQIMTIIKSANPPITLRLKSKLNMVCPKVTKRRNSFSVASSSKKVQKKYGPKRTRRMSFMSVNTTNNTRPSQLMLNSFCAENMPISTVLSSSSDEANNENHHKIAIEESENEMDSDHDDEDDSKQYVVNWNNIRMGASVLKYGWGLDKEDDDDNEEDDITFELACNALTTQGLNVYEIRAAFRLIRTQPEQIPPLETFKQLTIQNKSIDNGINTQFLSKQWLKEKNMSFVEEIREENKDENDGDIEFSEDEEEYFSNSSDCESMSEQIFEESLPRSSSLRNILQQLTVKKDTEKPKRCDEIHKIRKPVSGYIDFFDDNETSTESESISESIHIDKLFEAIGLSSPPLTDLAALYSTDDGGDGADSSMLFGLQRDANGHFVKVADTSDESSSYYCSDDAVEQENIISSCIKTDDDGDMFFDDCLPQVMIKYDYNRRKDEENEFNFEKEIQK